LKIENENKLPLNITFNNIFLQNKLSDEKIKKTEKKINSNNNNNGSIIIHKRSNSRRKSLNKNNENLYENKITQMNKVINQLFIKERDINFSKPKIEEKNDTIEDLNDSPIFERYKNIRDNNV